ncbi:hypothetical protein OpiT1DRAFT_01830 [Opitutaceae bacterium TAV1]|nr:hypothetical protein OPIT5_17520 [Opitutaceae bacterium TAV5]EIP97393.1 hypothetical protein OpiT1DRAFT_01830 [Opitutaceae bacterium TAV1]
MHRLFLFSPGCVLWVLALACSFWPAPAGAWDYEGHRIVNQLALAGLPPEFPAFVREPANAERIAFLAGEPDRWRNVEDGPLRHAQAPDHFFDIEYPVEGGLPLAKLSEFRQVFAGQLAEARKAHPSAYPKSGARDKDRTQDLVGFLPWAIAENYARVKSAFTYLKAYEALGTPEEIANARANVVYQMGLLGHYLGDGAQPLHTTRHFNGWSEGVPNPRGFTTRRTLHSWIDGGYLAAAQITAADLLPRALRADPLALPAGGKRPEGGRDPVFEAALAWLARQHEQVVPLYELEKAGELNAPPATRKGRAFIEQRLLEGGRALAAFWLTAWREAGQDFYLTTQLRKRREAAE